jgi:hypothetical protein
LAGWPALCGDKEGVFAYRLVSIWITSLPRTSKTSITDSGMAGALKLPPEIWPPADQLSYLPSPGKQVKSITLSRPLHDKDIEIDFSEHAGKAIFTVPRIEVYGIVSVAWR